jgi:NAD(P)-dependent dehydrogenase (short-subunit alcohol dehydrogenase family)
MTSVRDAVAVVTGGGSGIGLGIARALSQEGARVVIADLRLDAARLAADEVGGTALEVDVADAASVKAMIAATVVQHGAVDILVNNAGVGPQAQLAEMTLDDWRWLLDVNLWGVIHGVHAALPHMLERGTGHLVNVASMAAVSPSSPLGGYAVAKAGVAALTEVLGQELAGTGVVASLVLPGPTHTGIDDSMRYRTEGSGALRNLTIAPPADSWRTAEQVGAIVLEGIQTNLGIIPTHPELWSRVAPRYARLAQAFGRMGADD